MRNILLVLLMGLSANAQDLKISKPAEFQFIHCVQTVSTDAKAAAHFVIDLRDTEKNKLYMQMAPKKAKAKALKQLNIVDGNLQQNVNASADVSWKTAGNTVISLNIIDNDGYNLEGSLVNEDMTLSLKCVDVTKE